MSFPTPDEILPAARAGREEAVQARLDALANELRKRAPKRRGEDWLWLPSPIFRDRWHMSELTPDIIAAMEAAGWEARYSSDGDQHGPSYDWHVRPTGGWNRGKS